MMAVKQRKKKEGPLSKRDRIREYLQGCPDLRSINAKEIGRIFGANSSEIYKVRRGIYKSRAFEYTNAGRDEMLKETPKELSCRKEPTGKRGRVLEYLRNQPDLANIKAREIAVNFGVHITEVYRARKLLREEPVKPLLLRLSAQEPSATLAQQSPAFNGAGDDGELIGDLVALNKMGVDRVRRAVKILDRLSMEDIQ